MVVGVCFYGSEVVCTDGPEDDRGLHQRVCRLRSVVCSARAAAVVSYLKDIASKIAVVDLPDASVVIERKTIEEVLNAFATVGRYASRV